MCDQGERWHGFLVNSLQCFGEQGGDRSKDDSYIIAQMKVGDFFYMPGSGAPFISFIPLFHQHFVSFLTSTRSKPAKELTDWTHPVNKWANVHTHAHTPHNISIKQDVMTQPFSNMPYLHWTRITKGTHVIQTLPPYLVSVWRICTRKPKSLF